MRNLTRIALIGFSALTFNAQAQVTSAAPPQDPSRGWWFFKEEIPKEASEPEAEQPQPQQQPQQQNKPKEDKCKKKDTWSAACGFVNPQGDFAFQSKQRDALFEQMVVSNNDQKAVEAVQRYMQWVIGQSQNITRVWQYNMLQNPELDPSAKAPVSTVGLKLITNIRENDAKEYFKLITAEGGGFVYFSRSDCQACNEISYNIKSLQKDTGIPVANASLNGVCDPQYPECVTGAAAFNAATALKVTVVPALFLHLPENTWIRVANGVTDENTIKERTVQFFQAYRNAMVTGAKKADGSTGMDFNTEDSSALTKTQIPNIDEKHMEAIFKGTNQ
jgi:conjugal transfer pilus assembly protein TraF